MITQADLNQAIAECKGKRNPDARTCIMLAAFLTIQRELYGEEKDAGYSYSPAPSKTIQIDSGSEFAEIVNGKTLEEVLPVLDELMSTLKVIQPRLYAAVVGRLA